MTKHLLPTQLPYEQKAMLYVICQIDLKIKNGDIEGRSPLTPLGRIQVAKLISYGFFLEEEDKEYQEYEKTIMESYRLKYIN